MSLDLVTEVVEDFPAGSRGRTSPLAPVLTRVAQEQAGRVVRVARSDERQKIASLIQSARNTAGPPEANGWEFRTASEENGDGSQVFSLFALYDPSRIVEGEAEKHEAKIAERAKKSAAADKARKAKAAKEAAQASK